MTSTVDETSLIAKLRHNFDDNNYNQNNICVVNVTHDFLFYLKSSAV